MKSADLERVINLFKSGMDDKPVRELALLQLEAFAASMRSEEAAAANDEPPEEDENYNLTTVRRLLAGNSSAMAKETLERIGRDLSMAMDNPLDGAAEAANSKKRNILERVLRFPLIPYRPQDVERCRKAMDASHEGLDELKQALLDEIALSAVSGARPQPLLLVGQPGSGKTSLATSLAEALGPHGHAVIGLSGKSSAHELVGSDKSWRAADFGIILVLSQKLWDELGVS